MQPAEIVRSYRNADRKAMQIRILSELNACSESRIIEVLTKAGETVPVKKKRTRREPKQNMKEEQKQDTKSPAKQPTKKESAARTQGQQECVALTASEAETLADFLGLTMVPAIQEKTNMIENPEYIEELAAIYRKCAVAARAAGTSETPLVFQTEKRYLNKGGCVW